jgi:hypothetical protein
MAYYEYELAVMAGLNPVGLARFVNVEPVTTKSLENAQVDQTWVFSFAYEHLLSINNFDTFKVIYRNSLA